MDNKKTVIGMAAVFLLCMGYWFFLVHYVYPKHPEWDYAGTLNQTTQAENSGARATTEPASGTAATGPSIGAAPGSTLLLATTQPAGAPTILGSDQPGDAEYALGMQIDPRGAGLDAVTLNSYKDADAKGLYKFQQPYADAGERPLATRSVVIDGQSVDLSAANWLLEPGSKKTTATYGVDIAGANHSPLLHISKTYQLQGRGPEKNRDNTAAGYDVTVTYHLQNATTRPLNDVRLEFDGPTMPPREMERTDDRQIVSGYDKGSNGVDVSRDYLAEFKPGAEEKDLSIYKGYKLLWVGASSNYFTAIVLAENQGQLEKVQARCLNPSAEADGREVVLDFQTAAFSLPGRSSLDVPLKIFFGPKERDLLEGDFYGEFPRTYYQLLSSSSGFCGICAFPWLVDKLVDLLRFFHFFLRDWGLSIIALVVLVRAVLHPISKHSQVSMLHLQKMGPELERLKKKYANDKEALAKAQMEMHKQMGITPFLGCLPMFLQMPIWIALYTALQNDIVLRQAPFLWGLTWIHDLARPDRLLSWDQHPFTVPLIGMKVVSLNVLPLVVAVVMFLQQKLQPQPPTLTPEQASQQKMMRYMSLAFSLFFYWMPSGLNLYILTSSSLAIVESKRIREHIKRREEQEKANKVIVDVKPTRQGKQQQKLDPSAQASKKGGLGGWWASLQEKAESIRREAEKKNRK
ncbi:MAG: YidC/Oxa1 family insertase periplasmic-domain containing protein [Tepidisphaeraceae bacterium]